MERAARATGDDAGRARVVEVAVRHEDVVEVRQREARRVEALRKWRAASTERLGLEPGLLLPNRLISVIAEAAPHSTEALAALDGVRRWRAEHFGRELIAALERP